MVKPDSEPGDTSIASLAIWLRFAGLFVTAWLAGELLAWAANGGGGQHFDGDVTRPLLAVSGWSSPLALAFLWMWPPLTRRDSATVGVLAAGLVGTVVFVTGPRDPGGEYQDNWAWYTLAAGTIWYGVMAMLAWCSLWLVARVLRRER